MLINLLLVGEEEPPPSPAPPTIATEDAKTSQVSELSAAIGMLAVEFEPGSTNKKNKDLVLDLKKFIGTKNEKLL